MSKQAKIVPYCEKLDKIENDIKNLLETLKTFQDVSHISKLNTLLGHVRVANNSLKMGIVDFKTTQKNINILLKNHLLIWN